MTGTNTNYRVYATETGYELYLHVYVQDMDRVVSIPAGEFDTLDAIFAAYPELAR